MATNTVQRLNERREPSQAGSSVLRRLSTSARARARSDSIRRGASQIRRRSFSSLTTRIGIILLLASLGLMLRYADNELLEEILVRVVYAEISVQILFAMVESTMSTSVHMMITALAFIGVIYLYPVAGAESSEQALRMRMIVLALGLVPVGLYTTFKGIVESLLERGTRRAYWMLRSESMNLNFASSAGNTSAGSSLRNHASLVFQLAFTKKIIQTLELVGLDAYSQKALVNARNHFLYRIRHSMTYKSKLVAADKLLQTVGTIAIQRTASQIVKPSGTVNSTLNIMQDEMTHRILGQVELVIKPLPSSVEPTRLWKLFILCVAALLSHKRFFKYLKHLQGGTLHPGLQAAKYMSRFGILIYLTGRYAINLIRSGSTNGFDYSAFRIK